MKATAQHLPSPHSPQSHQWSADDCWLWFPISLCPSWPLFCVWHCRPPHPPSVVSLLPQNLLAWQLHDKQFRLVPTHQLLSSPITSISFFGHNIPLCTDLSWNTARQQISQIHNTLPNWGGERNNFLQKTLRNAVKRKVSGAGLYQPGLSVQSY